MFKAGPDRHLVTPFPLVGNELPGWLLRTVTALDDSNPPRWLRSGWSRGSDQELELLELETFVADSELAAARRLWRALGDFELATMTDDSVGPGEARSANDDHTVIIFRRANVVAAVANDRQYTRPIRDAAADFDAVLIHMSR